MSKRIIWIGTVFIGLAMTTLILFQAFWIKNAIMVKEKQFNQLITRSMIDIVHEIEQNEVSEIIMRQVNQATSDSGIAVPLLGTEAPSADISTGKNNLQNSSVSNDNRDSLSNEQERKSQAGEWLENRRDFVDRVIAGMLYVSPDIEKRISSPELENTIQKVFDESGIDMPFEYAVLRWNNDTVYRSSAYDPFAEAEYYRVQLFPNDVFANSSYLKLYFPNKAGFLYRSLSFLAVSSLVLTLAILISFALTVFIMFRQKRLSEIRSDFVSNMTHELKTPISTISLASQLLSDKSIPTETKNVEQISKIITDECRRLGSQVEKVLQTAVFDKGKLRLRLGEVNVHEIIDSVIENFSLQVKSRGGKISLSQKAENFIIQADQVHLTNVLSNLLDNAIKYCNRNPEITVETFNKMEFLVISVSDNGIGISRNDQKRIFEKFYRVPTGNIHTVKGFGLGLSYVKMIIEEHHGYVEVESELFEGSTFKIYLPLKEINHHAKD